MLGEQEEGERFGEKLSGSDAKAGAGGARSMRDSGKSGSVDVSVDERTFKERVVTSDVELP